MKAILFTCLLILNCGQYLSQDIDDFDLMDDSLDFLLDFDDEDYLNEIKEEAEYDLQYIERSEIPMHLDAYILVDKSINNTMTNKGFDEKTFLGPVIDNLTEIFGWHHIKFAIRYLSQLPVAHKFKAKHSEDVKSLKKFLPNLQDPPDTVIVLMRDTSSKMENRIIFGSMCTEKAMIFINMVWEDLEDHRRLALSIAHEIGHLIGIHHHEPYEQCNCALLNSKYCMMNAHNHLWTKSMTASFFNCHIFNVINNPEKFKCLTERHSNERLWTRCGDSFKDVDEQCDCTNPIICFQLTQQGHCCDAETCKYKDRCFQCLDGKCCRECMITNRTICRPAKRDCDIEEVCDGVSNICPQNKFQPDGYPCEHDTGRCYKGICFHIKHLEREKEPVEDFDLDFGDGSDLDFGDDSNLDFGDDSDLVI